MINQNELENKQTVIALNQMCEVELVQLHDRIETLLQDFQRNPLRSGESRAAVAAAQRNLKIWNAEVKRILKSKQIKEIA